MYFNRLRFTGRRRQKQVVVRLLIGRLDRAYSSSQPRLVGCLDLFSSIDSSAPWISCMKLPLALDRDSHASAQVQKLSGMTFAPLAQRKRLCSRQREVASFTYGLEEGQWPLGTSRCQASSLLSDRRLQELRWPLLKGCSAFS